MFTVKRRSSGPCIYACDRCGATEPERQRCFPIPGWTLLIRSRLLESRPSEHLCPSCRVALDAWMANPNLSQTDERRLAVALHTAFEKSPPIYDNDLDYSCSRGAAPLEPIPGESAEEAAGRIGNDVVYDPQPKDACWQLAHLIIMALQGEIPPVRTS